MATLGMRGSEFKNYFDKIELVKKQFLKVTSIDEIPRTIKLKHFLICNLSPSDKPGSHWVAIVRSEKDTLEIFNSLGTKSLTLYNEYFNFRTKFNIEYNEEQFQSNESSSCGYFCIYFMVHRILNFDMSLEHLLEHIFKSDFSINETLVTNFCNKLLQNDLNFFD
jgi:hypothetical protein